VTARAWTRGKAVVDGQLRYVSPSQLVSADHSSVYGCLRKWWYRRVDGRPEPEGKAAAEGTKGHGQIEEYLHTGRMVLGQHALAAKHYFPPPSPDLALELSIDDGTLLAAGTPVVGFIDFLNTSGIVQLDEGPVEEGGAEIVDWKFTGRDPFPSPAEVASAIPMTVYGEWAARKLDLQSVRLSHVYISTRRREASKRSLLVPREKIADRWVQIESLVGRLQQTAAATSADEVDANLNACSYCPHRSYCKAGEQRTLVDLLGPAAAAQLLNKENEDMSLLNIPALAKLAADPVADAKAALIAEEAAVQVDPAVAAAIAVIGSRAGEYGLPTLEGDAAKVWIAVTRQGSGEVLAGSGDIASCRIANAADLVQLAEEVKALPAKAPPAQAMGLLPPDAPKSDPVAALAKLEGTKPAPVDVPVPIGTGNASPAPAPAPEIPIGNTPAAEDAGELKLSKKARAYVDGLLAKIAELEAERAESVTFAARDREAPAPAARVEVYVDALSPEPMTDLGPWVRAQAKRLADMFNAVDIRACGNDTAGGFGKWKGHLAALCAEAELAPGVYALDTRGSEVAEAAVDGLRARAGARVTRGIR
jgi:hypothetical protein